MIYNPKSDHDRKKAIKRFDSLMANTKPFEMTGLGKRSKSQNAILHVYLSYLALELGCEMSYIKLQIWKLKWNRKMFYVEKVSTKSGEVYKYVRSSADLTVEEMSKAIKVLIEKASIECNVIFPDKNSTTYDDDFILMQKEIYDNEQFL